MHKITFFLQFLTATVFSQNYFPAQLPAPNDGKCYSMCVTPTFYDTSYTTLAIYSGNTPKKDPIEKQKIIVRKNIKTWQKKQLSAPCLAPNPSDCAVWCIVGDENKTEKFKVVTDTLNCKQFILKKVEIIEMRAGSNMSVWIESLCDNAVDDIFTKKLMSILTEKGLLKNLKPNPTIALRDALWAYQKTHQLPVGGLTIETLRLLGIN